MSQQQSFQSHLPSFWYIHSGLQKASRAFGPGCHCHGSRFKNRLRWMEEKEAWDVRRQRQLEESWKGRSTKQKKRGRWKQGHKVFLDEGERVRKQRGGVCGLEGGGRVPRSFPASIFDAPAHFHYFWLDADEGSSRQSGTKVHLSCWPTLAATKCALWGGFSLMDGQQRLLGRHATPEPLNILALGGRGKRKDDIEKKNIRTVSPPFKKCSNILDSETIIPHWQVSCWNQWQCQPQTSKCAAKKTITVWNKKETILKRRCCRGIIHMSIKYWRWQNIIVSLISGEISMLGLGHVCIFYKNREPY